MHLLLLVGKLHVIGYRHRLTLEGQAFSPATDDLQGTLRVSTIGLLDLQPLFGLGDLGALPGHRLDRHGMALLGQRQALMPRCQARLPLLDTFLGERQQTPPAPVVVAQCLRLSLPVRAVVGQLGKTRLVLALGFTAVPDFSLQPRDFGIGRKQVALRRMDAVTGSKMRFARRLQTRFEVTQGGILRLEIVGRLGHLARQPLALGLGLVAAEQPEQVLSTHQVVAILTILTSNAGLALEALHLQTQFEADVFHARQVLTRIGQPILGFLPPFLVAGHTGRLFEKDTQFVWPGLDDPRDRPLADDRIRPWPETGAEKQVSHVLASNVQVVDVILGLTTARQQALDGQLRILRPLSAEATERVIEDEFDGCPRHRLATAGTVEDHILHRLATQLRGFRFAEYPAHGIHHVRLAATIRTDHTDELTGQGDRRRVDEGFEAGKFQFGQAHERELERGPRKRAGRNRKTR